MKLRLLAGHAPLSTSELSELFLDGAVSTRVLLLSSAEKAIKIKSCANYVIIMFSLDLQVGGLLFLLHIPETKCIKRYPRRRPPPLHPRHRPRRPPPPPGRHRHKDSLSQAREILQQQQQQQQQQQRHKDSDDDRGGSGGEHRDGDRVRGGRRDRDRDRDRRRDRGSSRELQKQHDFDLSSVYLFM